MEIGQYVFKAEKGPVVQIFDYSRRRYAAFNEHGELMTRSEFEQSYISQPQFADEIKELTKKGFRPKYRNSKLI